MYAFLEKKENTIGIQTDHGYDVLLNGEHIGYIYTSDMEDGIFIEWVEIKKEQRGKHFFRGLLLGYMKYVHVKEIFFECGENLLTMYQHFGSVVLEYDDFREIYYMKLNLS